MCMKGTAEHCILLERVTKVEVRQNVVIVIMLLVLAAVFYMAFKMLNAQIFMLTGVDGLRSISTETRSDIKSLPRPANL